MVRKVMVKNGPSDLDLIFVMFDHRSTIPRQRDREKDREKGREVTFLCFFKQPGGSRTGPLELQARVCTVTRTLDAPAQDSHRYKLEGLICVPPGTHAGWARFSGWYDARVRQGELGIEPVITIRHDPSGVFQDAWLASDLVNSIMSYPQELHEDLQFMNYLGEDVGFQVSWIETGGSFDFDYPGRTVLIDEQGIRYVSGPGALLRCLSSVHLQTGNKGGE